MASDPRPSRHKWSGPAILVGLAGTGALVWWLAVPSQPADHDDGAAARATQPSVHEAAPQAQLPAVAEIGIDPLDAAPPAIVALPAEPTVNAELPHVANDRLARMCVSPDYFAEKYADAPTAELEAAEATLGRQVGELMHEASRSFLDSNHGNFETKARAASLQEQPPTNIKSDGLIFAERTQVTANGELLVQSGKLPWEENISLYDKKDEQLWLLAELVRRSRLASASEFAGTPTDRK